MLKRIVVIAGCITLLGISACGSPQRTPSSSTGESPAGQQERHEEKELEDHSKDEFPIFSKDLDFSFDCKSFDPTNAIETSFEKQVSTLFNENPDDPDVAVCGYFHQILLPDESSTLTGVRIVVGKHFDDWSPENSQWASVENDPELKKQVLETKIPGPGWTLVGQSINDTVTSTSFDYEGLNGSINCTVTHDMRDKTKSSTESAAAFCGQVRDQLTK